MLQAPAEGQEGTIFFSAQLAGLTAVESRGCPKEHSRAFNRLENLQVEMCGSCTQRQTSCQLSLEGICR